MPRKAKIDNISVESYTDLPIAIAGPAANDKNWPVDDIILKLAVIENTKESFHNFGSLSCPIRILGNLSHLPPYLSAPVPSAEGRTKRNGTARLPNLMSFDSRRHRYEGYRSFQYSGNKNKYKCLY